MKRSAIEEERQIHRAFMNITRITDEALRNELQLIRAMTHLATEAVRAAEDGELSPLPAARIVLEHVQQRIEWVEQEREEEATPKLRAVES